MSTDDPIRLSLARPEPAPEPLFRPEAMQAASEPLHGPVSVAMPPGALAAALVSLLALVMLGTAAFIVEVPQRTRAAGVLMPSRGFMRIAATEAGQVVAVHAAEGARVSLGEPLLTVSSDSGVIEGGRVSATQLLSLRNEQRLVEEAKHRRQRIQREQIRAIDDQLENVDLRLKFLNEERDIQRARGTILQKRFDRLQRLASRGNVPAVQLDEEQLALLQATAVTAALQQQAAQVLEEREHLSGTRKRLADEALVQELEFEVSDEQLQRQIAMHERAVGRALLAPENGIVARVIVRAGQVVHPGQTLMTLARGEDELEAWLYLPSTNAGLLRTGQEVQLRLDSYPYQVYGTQHATIASISRIAVLPSELDVPLAVTGPSFEVRATLDEQHIMARGRAWPLAAGTSVQADIVQQRFRLYEWLWRLTKAGSRRRHPADA
jgi:membrane fusion protein